MDSTNVTLSNLFGRAPLNPGEKLQGNNDVFIIEECIACGGNALIYRANSKARNIDVLVKEFFPVNYAVYRSADGKSIKGANDSEWQKFIEKKEKAKDEKNLIAFLLSK